DLSAYEYSDAPGIYKELRVKALPDTTADYIPESEIAKAKTIQTIPAKANKFDSAQLSDDGTAVLYTVPASSSPFKVAGVFDLATKEDHYPIAIPVPENSEGANAYPAFSINGKQLFFQDYASAPLPRAE